MHNKIPLCPIEYDSTMQHLFNNAYLDKRLSVSLHINNMGTGICVCKYCIIIHKPMAQNLEKLIFLLIGINLKAIGIYIQYLRLTFQLTE